MKHDAKCFSYDVIRGLSALLVCAGHLRAMMFVNFGSVAHPSAIWKAFYFLTGLGHQAVMVFFVLSGFFVGGSIIRTRKAFDWGNYLTSRLTRLWVVLIPALIFTALLDTVTRTYAPEAIAGSFASSWVSGPSPQEPWSIHWLTFLGNLGFVQKVFVPVFGTNGPLWSLTNEFWYYILAPALIVLAGFTNIGGLKRWGLVLLVVMIAWKLPLYILGGFLIWLLGLVVALLPPLTSKLRIGAQVLGAVAFLGSLALSKKLSDGFINELVVGYAFAFWAYTLKGGSISKEHLGHRLFIRLSDISYSLYLFHFPIVVLIGGVALKGLQYQPGGKSIGIFTGVLALLIAVGWVAWWAFESRTSSVRKRIPKMGSSVSR